jgi:ActR/RegA family two-component response regulator
VSPRSEPAEGRTCVVADEDAAARGALVGTFKRLGYHCFEADHAESLWAAPLAVADVIVLDPNLPGGSWPSLLLEVCRVAPRARRVVVTAYASQAMRHAARALNSQGFLEKPTSPSAVLERLAARPEPALPAVPSIFSFAAEVSEAAGASQRRLVSLSSAEWEHINWVLLATEGCVASAARILKIPRQTLYRKLRKYPTT